MDKFLFLLLFSVGHCDEVLEAQEEHLRYADAHLIFEAERPECEPLSDLISLIPR